jgi:ubiquinone biosynthesis protein
MKMAQWLALAKLARHALKLGLHHFVDVNELPKGAAQKLLLLLQKMFAAPTGDQAERLCATVESLGPVYIKLGQLLSTRRDLLPEPIVNALTKLQDRVDPIDAFAVAEAVSAHLNQPSSQVFHHIEAQPLASASIAQVHAATLSNGQDVVIKLVRPGISQRINADMDTLEALAAFLCRNTALARRLHLDRVMRDHRAVLNRELDMFAEGRNQIQLRRNFADSPLLYVPRVYSEYSRRSMLVMERVYGVPIGQIDTLQSANVDFKVLAHKGVETFFTQVFDHNFFHADMHPGNIQVDVTDPSNPSYIALDCAIIGSLEQQDIDYLAQNILAFFRRDYRAVVDLHLRSGWIPATTDADAFERVIADLCDPIFNKPLSEISFADFMTQLLRTAADFNMEIQPQLVLLQKTLLYVEGLGRQLYPQLDLWETAMPFMQRWATRNLGPLAIFNQLLEQAPQLVDNLHRLPELLRQDTLPLRIQLAQQSQTVDALNQQVQRLQRHQRLGKMGMMLTVVTALVVLALM